MLLHIGIQNLGAVDQTVPEIFRKNRNFFLNFSPR